LNIGEKWAWQKVVNPQEIQTYPSSLYALLSAYLRPAVDDGTKHRLVQYVSMDLTWIFGSRTNFGNILQLLAFESPELRRRSQHVSGSFGYTRWTSPMRSRGPSFVRFSTRISVVTLSNTPLCASQFVPN
jgi:hypothetical protein